MSPFCPRPCPHPHPCRYGEEVYAGNPSQFSPVSESAYSAAASVYSMLLAVRDGGESGRCCCNLDSFTPVPAPLSRRPGLRCPSRALSCPSRAARRRCCVCGQRPPPSLPTHPSSACARRARCSCRPCARPGRRSCVGGGGRQGRAVIGRSPLPASYAFPSLPLTIVPCCDQPPPPSLPLSPAPAFSGSLSRRTPLLTARGLACPPTSASPAATGRQVRRGGEGRLQGSVSLSSILLPPFLPACRHCGQPAAHCSHGAVRPTRHSYSCAGQPGRVGSRRPAARGGSSVLPIWQPRAGRRRLRCRSGRRPQRIRVQLVGQPLCVPRRAAMMMCHACCHWQ